MQENINIATVQDFAPKKIDRAKQNAWLRVILSPLRRLFGLFELFKASQDLELAQTGQVIALRKLLNDRIDPVQRRITIQDGTNGGFVLSNIRATIISAAQPNIIGTQGGGYDFIIKIPSDFTNRLSYVISNAAAKPISDTLPTILANQSDAANVAQIAALGKRYKIDGKTFNINT